MKSVNIMEVFEWKAFFGIKTIYAVSKTEALEIKKEIVLNNFNLN